LNNRLLLKQARDGIKKHIEQSPFAITVTRRALIDNGFGGQCEDPEGIPATVNIMGRMSRESRIVQAIAANSAGMDTSATMYLIISHNDTIFEGDQFPGWRVGRVTPLNKFEGVIAFEAALYPA
jgi:hypothetical protein